jgi:prepilin signal peptidase PulO-like enzyme (type II secretory pathway)
MNRGPLPLRFHAAIEPLIGIVLIAAPWIFGFSDANDAKTLCIVLGIIVIIAGALTDWRVSLVRLIPLRMHLMTDLLIALVLIVSPFVLGFSGNGGATRFVIIAGVLEAIAALSTRWDVAEAAPERSTGDSRSRSTASTGHRL